MNTFFMNCKRNIKIASKSVLSSWKEYICFFVALLIVQSALCISGITYYNNKKNERAVIKSEYDYHLVLRSLSTEQFAYMLNDKYNVKAKYHIYNTVRTKEIVSSSGKVSYDMFVTFEDPVRASYQAFIERYYNVITSDENFTHSVCRAETSPLLDLDKNGSAASAGEYAGIVLLVTALSFLLLMILYRIRLNHFKFTYSIYMTCGADFKKLLGSAFWEMLVIALICAVPSAVLSYVVAGAIYIINGAKFGFYIMPILLMCALSLLVSLLSVIIPIKSLSRKRPVKLMAAEDNSNLVISPKKSFRMLGRRFPRASELYSIWRFRSYFAALIASSVLFSSFFVCGIYLTSVYSGRRDYPHNEYKIEGFFSSGEDEALESARAIDNVRAVVCDKSVSAADIDSHILVRSDECKTLSKFAVFPQDSGWAGNIMVDYHPADRSTLDNFSSFYRYECEGDPEKVLSDGKRYCIISDSMANKTVYKIKPGDKIMVAIGSYLLPRKSEGGDFLKGNEQLTAIYEKFAFTYREFEVAAVITNMPSFEKTAVYFSKTDFETITGESSSYGEACIYLDDDDLSAEEVSSISGKLSSICDKRGLSIEALNAATDARIEKAKNYEEIFTLFSVFILLVCPIVFIFSQILFYHKRKDEFDMMRAMGTVFPQIRRLHIIDAAVIASASSLLFCIFSKIGVSALCALVNSRWLYVLFAPASVGNVVRYYPALPKGAFIIGLIMSAASAAASCIVPYLIYKKRTSDSNINDIGIGEFSAQ